MYRDADFYVLDDPLSAVDAHVGEQLFARVIGPDGLLAKATRVVALNTTAHLGQFDLVVCLRGEREAALGCSLAFSAVRQWLLIAGGKIEYFGPPSGAPITTVQLKNASGAQPMASDGNNDDATRAETPIISAIVRANGLRRSEKKAAATDHLAAAADDDDSERRLIDEEASSVGRVLLTAYRVYLRAFGVAYGGIYLIAMLVGWPFFAMLGGLQLANWSAASSNQTSAESLQNLLVYGGYNCGGSERRNLCASEN